MAELPPELLQPTSALGAYEGVEGSDLARRWGVPAVLAYDEVRSTMDVAHRAAEAGALDGTVVLADGQSAGRGRNGHQWSSQSGAGIWLTVLARPTDRGAVGVLSLRLGLRIASALDPHAGGPVGLKWPNDLHVDGRKLGGVLTEVRWHDQRPSWVAIGVGINVRAPAGMRAASLSPGTPRLRILDTLVPAIRSAGLTSGPLSEAELAEYATRDVARGRSCRLPGSGRVEGIAATGELLISHHGTVQPYRTGSLVLTGDGPDGLSDEGGEP